MLQVECENYFRDDKREGTPEIPPTFFFLTFLLDLSRMYRLLSRIDDGIKPMLEVLQNYVSTTGFEAIKSIPTKDQKVTTNIYMGVTINDFIGTNSLRRNFVESLRTI